MLVEQFASQKLVPQSEVQSVDFHVVERFRESFEPGFALAAAIVNLEWGYNNIEAFPIRGGKHLFKGIRLKIVVRIASHHVFTRGVRIPERSGMGRTSSRSHLHQPVPPVEILIESPKRAYHVYRPVCTPVIDKHILNRR